MNLNELAAAINGTLHGEDSIEIKSIASILEAGPDDLTFVLSDKEIQRALGSKAKAFICFKFIDNLSSQIVVKNPRQALANVIGLFSANETPCSTPPTIDPSSDIHPSAIIGKGCIIGANCKIGAHVVLGDQCNVGNNVTIYPNVTIYDRTTIDDFCIIHAGSIIGSDGFGFYEHQGNLRKIPHIGTVRLDPHVEIGANTTVDRGCLGETHIKEGTKIDNLVHIAHNSVIGPHCAVAAQVGVTGSSSIGHHVMIGGQVGIDSSSVGNCVTIAGKSGVTKSIADGLTVSGFPAQSHRKELKYQATLRKLVKRFNNKEL